MDSNKRAEIWTFSGLEPIIKEKALPMVIINERMKQ